MIRVESVDFGYSAARQILRQVSFEAGDGQCVAILGNNGAGKSTLLKCLNRILSPQAGAVYLNGRDVLAMRRGEVARQLAYVAQKGESGRVTVFDAVLLGRKPYIRFEPSTADLELVSQLIERMGLTPFSLRPVDELSGGEFQKVMLARALAQRPQTLLLDEPTSNLDLKNQYGTMQLVREIARSEHITVVVVIHDLNLALRYCDRFLFVSGGSVLAWGGPEVVTSENLRRAYGIEAAVERVRGVPLVIPLPQ